MKEGMATFSSIMVRIDCSKSKILLLQPFADKLRTAPFPEIKEKQITEVLHFQES
jgi:hypothetical protein